MENVGYFAVFERSRLEFYFESCFYTNGDSLFEKKISLRWV